MSKLVYFKVVINLPYIVSLSHSVVRQTVDDKWMSI